MKTLNLKWFEVERLVQELAWREFFQNVWSHKKDGIFSDIKNQQINDENSGIPKAVLNAETGIEVLDDAVNELYETGYIHNHLRMYLSSVCTNIAHFHWFESAKWLYYNLLDGDLASNHLSWQWVCGTFSSKKYFANQDNLNKYFNSKQKNTFLDVDYSEFDDLKVPEILKESQKLNLMTILPILPKPNLENKKTLLFNYYNLDFKWHKDKDFQKVFLLEPSIFEKFPVSEKCIEFALKLSENIPNIKIFIGEFSDLVSEISAENISFKEHPLNLHYEGNSEKISNLFTVETECSSFFSYWKKVKKGLQKDFETN
ncbi:FAD-binding domain-containing protein [Halpernia frigidisoli]|uniref:Deoxyribodipyrimidine photo-lyase n=1 Tax=Halpernia frigidisoli TaxID=1125876 RepID=A0A1I3D9S3_9FLAO|nr:FAD-binding domain-containing protein [Halpernia frigidisoli]SFH83406.1 deoxyribodipyrimidine photo-lyase [Halpernia frigidisoli]